VALLCSSLFGCHGPGPSVAPSAPVPTARQVPPVTPEPSAAASQAPAEPADPKREAATLLIRAAQADLTPAETYEAPAELANYRAAAILLGVRTRIVRHAPAPDVVALGLATGAIDETEPALVDWVVNPHAQLAHRVIAFGTLARTPKPAHLRAFQAVL